MPNRRVPDHLKIVKGTYKPCRAAKMAPEGLEPLPEPPRRLEPHIRKLWREICRKAPHLRMSDMLIVEILCRLIHQHRTNPDMPAARIGLLRKILADCYMTPATRPNIPTEPERGEFEDF